MRGCGFRWGRGVGVGVSEVKAYLSELVNRIFHRNKLTVAEDIPPVANLETPRPDSKRKLGLLKSEIDVPDQALFESDEEIEKMFYGDEN